MPLVFVFLQSQHPDGHRAPIRDLVGRPPVSTPTPPHTLGLSNHTPYPSSPSPSPYSPHPMSPSQASHSTSFTETSDTPTGSQFSFFLSFSLSPSLSISLPLSLSLSHSFSLSAYSLLTSILCHTYMYLFLSL